ncbi:MAG: sigma-70 family RNA polymerase sigma factor [candidate division Zixibacteria bacterium]|nr:sigma-70 family RNA polymerase sigma factor [candidate division Zixibacteria bacterium]MBU1472068.1 sigma-70 family RNA polymerase sigma factor [candidate division Zixibacteria bacterium]MBU2623938.1 sigma-70 family RNA polymerase sigma factor [candidate division Zixibacteria bacterium]
MSIQMVTHENLDERELVQRAATGDRSAFKAIVDCFGARVINLANRITRNKMDAEDIAQDVFVEVYRNVGNFRGDSSLSTWILRIAHNRSLNYLRDKRPSNTVSLDTAKGQDDLPLLNGLPGKESDIPDRALEIERNRSILYDAIAELPEKIAKPFTLHKLDGMAYDEIARFLGISLSAVESRIHRAKIRLQKDLAKRLKR